MIRRTDSRIPVVFGSLASVGTADAALIERDAAAPPTTVPNVVTAYFAATTSPHAPECACCLSRTGAAEALGALSIARARAKRSFFGRVVVVTASRQGRDAVLQALAQDALAVARFRLDEP